MAFIVKQHLGYKNSRWTVVYETVDEREARGIFQKVCAQMRQGAIALYQGTKLLKMEYPKARTMCR